MPFHALRGMNDILPEEIPLWIELEQTARDHFSHYGFEEIRTPILEEMALFTRTIGETTNIVEKEMYVFQDRSEKWVALRPEGTAAVVRAYLEHPRPSEDPVARLFYAGPMYRYERPQKGRLRQFYQIGAEVFGIADPRIDAEIIRMVELYFDKVGIVQPELQINSLGCPLCRPKFLGAFLDFLRKNEKSLCTDCRRRMERNPLRALDCKEEGCLRITSEGPSIQDYLCEECEQNFDTVIETLGLLGSRYQINQRIVRGLDYYLRTTFEFVSPDLGAQNAVAGGGRYDGLVRLLGGPNVAGFGFALGMERLIELVKKNRKVTLAKSGVSIAVLGEKALTEGIKIAQSLRGHGIKALLDYEAKSLKSQMRRADKLQVAFVVILGEEEMKKGKVVFKNMETGLQKEVTLKDLEQELSRAS